MLKVRCVFVKCDERKKDDKTYRSVSLMIEGASEALRFPVDEPTYVAAAKLRSLQPLLATVSIDARIQKGDFSASPQLNLKSFEVA